MAEHLRLANAGFEKREIGDWAETETALDILRTLDLMRGSERPSLTLIAGAPGTGKTSAARRFRAQAGETAFYVQAARGEGTPWNLANVLALISV